MTDSMRRDEAEVRLRVRRGGRSPRVPVASRASRRHRRAAPRGVSHRPLRMLPPRRRGASHRRSRRSRPLRRTSRRPPLHRPRPARRRLARHQPRPPPAGAAARRRRRRDDRRLRLHEDRDHRGVVATVVACSSSLPSSASCSAASAKSARRQRRRARAEPERDRRDCPFLVRCGRPTISSAATPTRSDFRASSTRRSGSSSTSASLPTARTAWITERRQGLHRPDREERAATGLQSCRRRRPTPSRPRRTRAEASPSRTGYLAAT